MKVDLNRIRAALAGRAHVPAPLEGGERFAAVAAVLRERNGEAEVLLIRRAELEGDPWSGHMAFPGGRSSPNDDDLLHTAIRETEEEIGLRLARDRDLVGRLDDLPAIARGKPVGLVIAPFVFAVHDESDVPLVLNEREVREALWTPITPLLRGERNTTFPYRHDHGELALPAYDVDGRIVWGLTYRMLAELFEVLDGAPRARY
ncbi:MAG TPA: CoA pyrophosphatase [Polyangiaceae bacterium]|nr:CoA pyrophosphatase [Polyangiaceae bacterium]